MILVHWNHLRKFQSGTAVGSEITLVKSGTYEGPTSTLVQGSFTVSGIQANDVIILHASSDTGNDIWNTVFDKGTNLWEIDQAVTSIAGYYVATGTSETFSTVPDDEGEYGLMQNVVYSVWRGCDTTNPIDTSATNSVGTGFTTTLNLPSVTTTNDGCVLIAGFALDDDDWTGLTVPIGYTFITGQYTTSGGDSSNVMSYRTQETAGTESGKSYTVPLADPYVGWIIALKPA
jgi:hypothetical protein